MRAAVSKSIRAIPKVIASTLTWPLRPLAKRWARDGYFGRFDWPAIQPLRVVLIACHWIGDTFWASQVMPVLTQRFAGAQFRVITKPHSLDLWRGMVDSQHLIGAPQVVSDRRREVVDWAALCRLANDLRPWRSDLVIDLTGNRYSAIFTYLLGAKCSIGFDGGEFGWLYSHRVRHAHRIGQHLSERPFRVIEPLLGGTSEPFAYHLPLRPPPAACPADSVLAPLDMLDKPFVIIAPGAGWAAKQWPVEHFVAAGAELVRAGIASVVCGSAGEVSLCRRASAGIAGSRVLAGESIGRVVAAISHSRGMLGNDSGLAHLAAALGKPTAAVFTGQTNPKLCRPLGPIVHVFHKHDRPEEVAKWLADNKPLATGN